MAITSLTSAPFEVVPRARPVTLKHRKLCEPPGWTGLKQCSAANGCNVKLSMQRPACRSSRRLDCGVKFEPFPKSSHNSSQNKSQPQIQSAAMPNYEPTPRRFSTLYVPRSASRKNSIDGTALPDVVRNPTSHDHPPVDLTSALQHLQHVELGTERERGRTRKSGGDNARRTVLGHNDTQATEPSARRENSARTRERIAEWEARSRSQSKSRSKSRGRDVGSKHRISVVPEIPDLALSLSAFEQQEAVGGGGSKAPDQSTLGGHVDDGTESGIQRPKTPVCQTQQSPPTPDMTPKRYLSTTSADDETSDVHYQMSAVGKTFEDGEVSTTGGAPATPPPKAGSKGVFSMGLPLTPQATPERGENTGRWGDGDNPYPGESQRSSSSNIIEYAAVSQPRHSNRPAPAEDKTGNLSDAHYHLPSDLLSDESSQQREQPDRHTAASETSLRAADRPKNQTTSRAETGPLYHNVWRIDPYKPEFPLPDRPENYVDIQTLSQARFVGSPLQQLPQGRLPAEPGNFDGSDLGPYHVSRSSGSGGRDWAVEIPPSPSKAYVSDDQGIRRRRSRSRATGDYIARSEIRRHEWDTPSVMERAFHAASVSMIQGLNVPVEVYRGLRNIYYPAPDRPDIVKAYPIRQRLPIR